MEGARRKGKSVWKIFPWAMILLTILDNPCIGAEDPDKFPSRPIEYIVNSDPGGNADLTSRKIAELAGKILGQPIIVTNKSGGGGVIGINAVVKASPDGYTIGTVVYSPTTIIPHLRPVPYNTKEDFTFVVQYGEYIYVFGVLADSPWKTFKEFVGEARKNPGKLKYSSPFPLGGQHIFMEQVFKLEKAKVIYIPVKGGTIEATRMLLGGHLDGALTADLIAHLKEGKVRGLATQNEKRIPLIPEVPTFLELGYEKLESPLWVGICAPKGLDPRILKKLGDAFKKAYDHPSFRELLVTLNLAPVFRDSESFKALVLKDFDEQGRVLRDLGLVKN